MSNEHTVKSYEEELRYLIDSVIKMGSLTAVSYTHLTLPTRTVV